VQFLERRKAVERMRFIIAMLAVLMMAAQASGQILPTPPSSSTIVNTGKVKLPILPLFKTGRGWQGAQIEFSAELKYNAARFNAGYLRVPSKGYDASYLNIGWILNPNDSTGMFCLQAGGHEPECSGLSLAFRSW
jgi:hypothetical protein